MRPLFFMGLTLLVAASLLTADAAQAARLQLDAQAAPWAHVAAATLLVLHIGGGTIGLVAGAVATFTRKGGQAHRLSGRVFLAGMAVTYGIGTVVAPFVSDGRRTNFVAGILALYLLITGVAAARRRRFVAGAAEAIGFIVALAITALGVLFMAMAAHSESGTVDGSPPQAFVVFVVAGIAAATGDLRAFFKRSLSNAARITRHLWRMCASFFFASGSLFFGQSQLFPAWFDGSALQLLLGFGPLLVMAAWFARAKMERRAVAV